MPIFGPATTAILELRDVCGQVSMGGLHLAQGNPLLKEKLV